MAVAPRLANALDAEVRAESTASTWQVRGPSGAPVLSLRRFTQTLTLGASHRPEDPRGPRVTIRARLRIDSDFGAACDPSTDRCLDELNLSRAAEFAPLFARRSLDLPWAYVDVESIGRGALDLRVGRQLVVDALGFMLFDGGRARLHLGRAIALEVYGGLETRAGFPLSNGRYERDGVARLDRDGWDASLAPSIRDAVTAGVFAAAVELRGAGPVYARATWRRVWTSEGTVEEKAALRVDVDVSRRVSGHAEAVWSFPHDTATLALAGVTWRSGRGHLVGVDVERVRPVFDATTIWASFWTDPTDDARARVEVPLSRGWSLTVDALGRRYALSASSTQTPDQFNAGGGAGLHARRPRWELSARARGEGGGLGSRVGADLSARRWMSQSVRLDGGVSLWSVNDTLRDDRDITSGSLWVGVMVRLGRVARMHLTLEDDVNRVVGQRLRAFALLDLGTSL
ncbi:MAG: hypothetical protein R3A52_21660 [Polyangiales bacterium]